MLELRSIPGQPEYATVAFIEDDGDLVGLDGNALQIPAEDLCGTSYYLVIRHRNHLDIMSAAAVTASGNTFTYDFTTAQAQAYLNTGDAMKEIVTGVFGLFRGDADQDHDVDNDDYWVVRGGSFLFGYNVEGYHTGWYCKCCRSCLCAQQ